MGDSFPIGRSNFKVTHDTLSRMQAVLNIFMGGVIYDKLAPMGIKVGKLVDLTIANDTLYMTVERVLDSRPPVKFDFDFETGTKLGLMSWRVVDFKLKQSEPLLSDFMVEEKDDPTLPTKFQEFRLKLEA